MLKEKLQKIGHDSEDGLSLLEIVIAVAIIAIFAVVGIIGFQKLTDNARQTVVEAAAEQVYTGAAAALSGIGDSDLSRVEREYNETADEPLEVSVSGNDLDSLCVVAEYDKHTAERGYCTASVEDNTSGDNGNSVDGVVSMSFNIAVEEYFEGYMKVNIMGTVSELASGNGNMTVDTSQLQTLIGHIPGEHFGMELKSQHANSIMREVSELYTSGNTPDNDTVNNIMDREVILMGIPFKLGNVSNLEYSAQ